MALIKCPECGENVSSSAERCIHCGAEFTVCPECEQIYLGKPETCNNCGYAFVSQKPESNAPAAHPNPAVQDQLKLYNVMGAWRVASPFHTKIDKYSKIAYMLFLVGTFAFLMAAIVFTVMKGINISDSIMNSFNDLLIGKSPAAALMNTVNVLIAFFVIFLVLAMEVPAGFSLYRMLSAGSMIKKYVPNTGRIIEYYKNRVTNKITTVGSEIDLTSSDMKDVGLANICVYLTDVKQAKMRYLLVIVSHFVLLLASLICLGIGLSQNAEAFFISRLYNTDFDFHYVSLIISVVLFIASKICGSVPMNAIANKAVDYCDKLCAKE